MKFLHMPKELNGLDDHVLWHWFPTRKSSHASVGRKTMSWLWDSSFPHDYDGNELNCKLQSAREYRPPTLLCRVYARLVTWENHVVTSINETMV